MTHLTALVCRCALRTDRPSTDSRLVSRSCPLVLFRTVRITAFGRATYAVRTSAVKSC